MLPISSFNIILHQQKNVLASSGSITVLYSLFQIELAAYIPQLRGAGGGQKSTLLLNQKTCYTQAYLKNDITSCNSEIQTIKSWLTTQLLSCQNTMALIACTEILKMSSSLKLLSDQSGMRFRHCQRTLIEDFKQLYFYTLH